MPVPVHASKCYLDRNKLRLSSLNCQLSSMTNGPTLRADRFDVCICGDALPVNQLS
jgi:hypothetical protein